MSTPATTGPSRGRAAKARRVGVATIAAFLLVLAATGVAAWGTHRVVRDQGSRLLKERAAELGLVFTQAVSTITTSMSSFLGVLHATGASPSAFSRAAAPEQAKSPPTSRLTMALVRRGADGHFQVVTVSGPLLKAGEQLTGVRAAALTKARVSKVAVPISTLVIGSGANRALGFALKASAIPGVFGEVLLYRETALGPLSAPRQADTAPFHELKVVLYASPQVDPKQLLVTTSESPTTLPTGGTRYIKQPAGGSTWLLGVRPKGSLVGGVAANAWWIVMIGGIGAALLVAGMVEFTIRRRDAALSLYAVEHQQAETLQRSLLPSLPQLADLELAARYEAGGVGQRVGGDWFDAFPLTSGGVGFVIGDVIGHDLEAAAAMSQVRAALRAFAYEGDEPAVVISRLDRLIVTFELTQLVSVIYGVLDPVSDNGTRVVRFANAGHLPPLLQAPDGTVTSLSGGASVVIGAPYVEARGQAELLLQPGSTMLLFTDGLLEAPELSLTDTIPELERTVAAHPPEAGCDAMCDRVLASRPRQPQRDDIALLAIRLRDVPARNVQQPAVRQDANVAPEVADSTLTGPAHLSRR